MANHHLQDLQLVGEYKGFKLVDSFQYQDYGTICKYKSEKTGLLVTLVRINSPIIKSYMAVRTRAADHDGIPHVLEHMVFLGSEDYPYKGLLDKVANRCLAQGTNAYTATTHTVYELSTGGKEGFYRLLPVFLDHILFARISQEGFSTEIHHIDGVTCQDSGVVYNEMLGRENTPDELLQNMFFETMFEGSEGYQFNTGGRVSNLRSLTVEKVRAFHSEYYCTQNLNVIVVGNTTPEELIDNISDSIESKVVKKLENNLLKAKSQEFDVWKQPVPQLSQSIVKEITYPSDELDSGYYVCIGWRAAPWNDFLTNYALSSLWSYLSDGDIAPLRKELVENENGEQWCGDLWCGTEEMKESVHRIIFVNVEQDKFKTIVEKFFNFIKNLKIDLEYMKLVLHRDKLNDLRDYETSPHETFSLDIIDDFLFGTNKEDLRESMDIDGMTAKLMEKDENYWNDLINKFFLNRPNVTVYNSPSAERAQEIAEESNKRVEEIKKHLGEEKLKELVVKLKEAEEANSKQMSPEALEKQFPIPSVDSIKEIHFGTYRNDNNYAIKPTEMDLQLKQKLEQSPCTLPFFLQVSSIASRFVDMHCYLDSSNIPLELKMYIPLFLAVNFSCDLKLGTSPEEYIKKEQVIYSLMQESISHDYGCGFTGSTSSESRNFAAGLFAELLYFHFTFEIEKYSDLVKWTRNFLCHTEYTPEVIETKIQVLLSEIQSYKISAEDILSFGSKHLVNLPESNLSVLSFILQEQNLSKILTKLKEEPQVVIDELKQLRNLLTLPENIRIHIAMDVDRFEPNYHSVLSEWQALFPNNTTPAKPLVKPCKWSHELATKDWNRGVLLGLSSTDSGYLLKVSKGIDFENYRGRHALSVAINFLTIEEGPFWVKLRGKGLCYGYSITSNVEKKTVSLYLSRVGNISQAVSETKAILETICSGEQANDLHSSMILDDRALQSAISATLFEKLEHVETMTTAAQSMFLSGTLFSSTTSFYTSLNDIKQVTLKDVRKAIHDYILPLVTEHSGALFICDNVEKVKGDYPVREELIEGGFNLATYPSFKAYVEKEFGFSSVSDEMSCEEGSEEDDGEEDEDMETNE